MRRCLLTLLLLASPFALGADGCAGPAPPAGLAGETWVGELRPVVPPPGSPFRSVGSEAVGRFRLTASGGDVRTHPDTAVLDTGTGRIVAQAVAVNEVRNVDPASGRPRLAGATDPCPTGAEASCWSVPGDPTDQGADAFDALCDWTAAADLFDDVPVPLPTTSCLLEVFENPEPVPGLGGIPEVISVQLGGGDACNGGSLGVCLVTNAVFGRTPFDPTTAILPLHPGLADTDFNGGPTLASLLTDAQEAALGCGPYFGTSCDTDGLRPFHAEAAAVLRSAALDATGEGAIRRTEADTGDVTLPGGRNPFDYFADPAGRRWNPSVDGCVVGLMNLSGDGAAIRADLVELGASPLEADQCDADPGDHAGNGVALDGYRAPIPDAVVPVLPLSFSYFDQTGDEWTPAEIETLFPTELALVAENLARLLDALTAVADPACDPATGCGIRAEYEAVAAVELTDDPSGLPRFRWLWETGAQYVVTEASGDLAPFLGWTLHAFGPEESRVAGEAFGVAFLLADPTSAIAAPDSPLSVRGDGGDGMPGTADDTVGAAAYGVPGPDADADGVLDVVDNCTEVANGPVGGGGNQVDDDGDGIGNACDCDFDDDGVCTLRDFARFVDPLVAGSDAEAIGADMDGDGDVDLNDFSLFLPGLVAGAPGPFAAPF